MFSFVVITSCAITDYDKEKIAKAVKSTAVDITEDSSNEEVGNEIKLKSDLSNLNVEVTGKSKDKYIVVSRKYLGLIDYELYSECSSIYLTGKGE